MRVKGIGSKTERKQMFWFCFYRFVLSITYVKGVALTYGYMGFTANKDSLRNIICWILFITLSICLIKINPEGGFSFSKSIVFTLFLLIYTPFSVAISYGMYTTQFFIANNLYWFVLIYFLAFKSKRRLKSPPHFLLGSIRVGEKFVTFFGIASLMLIVFISWRYTRFRINLSILNVYDLRSEARSFNMPTILRYMFGWTRIINSICLCISLIRGRKFMSCIFFLNQLLSFGIDGMKSSLFIMIVEIVIYVLYRNKAYKNEYNLLLIGFNLIPICALVEMLVLKTRWIVALILYRMEFLPVNISSNFFDFFTHNVPDYFRSSFLRFFGFSSPYVNINYMISNIYSGHNTNANNGLISDAITNMGYPGIVIMPIVLVLFFRFFDRCSQGINKYLVLTLSIYCAMTLSNMFFLPNLLTGGWLIALVIVLIIDREQTQQIIQK